LNTGNEHLFVPWSQKGERSIVRSWKWPTSGKKKTYMILDVPEVLKKLEPTTA